MRKAVVIAQKSRRGIPLHWNERCQGKNNCNHLADTTVARRIENRKARNEADHHLRNFKGDWEDFVPFVSKKPWLD